MTVPSRRQQLKRFFTTEYRILVSFVRKLLDDASAVDAEDIVQDVACSLFEKGDVLEPIEHLGAYIYQALRNRVIDTYRRGRQPDSSFDAGLGGDGEPFTLADVVASTLDSPENEAVRADMYRRITGQIKKLPPREQALIIATEIEGYSFSELAERWDVPIGTLLSQKSRSIRKIRSTLQSLESTSTDGGGSNGKQLSL